MDDQSVGAPRAIGRPFPNRLRDGCLLPTLAQGLTGIAQASVDRGRELIVFYDLCLGSVGAGDKRHTAHAFPGESSFPRNSVGDGLRIKP